MGLLENRIFGPRLKSSHAMVVEELGSGIVSGALSEGSVLPGDQELMERFGVSRTVLREAMKTLSAKRLIAAKSKVGTTVRPRDEWNFVDADVIGWRMRAGVDLGFVEHLAEMRLALEPATAALAARHATAEEVEGLRDLAERLADLAHTAESIAKADLDFHVAVARMSRNPFMRSVTSLIEAALAVTFQLSSPALSEAGITECAECHRAIADAIAAHDEAAAAEATRRVIENGMVRIRAAV